MKQMTKVFIRSPSQKWQVEAEISPIYGKPTDVTRRLRTMGVDAQTHKGDVWVNADTPRKGEDQ